MAKILSLTFLAFVVAGCEPSTCTASDAAAAAKQFEACIQIPDAYSKTCGRRAYNDHCPKSWK